MNLGGAAAELRLEAGAWFDPDVLWAISEGGASDDYAQARFQAALVLEALSQPSDLETVERLLEREALAVWRYLAIPRVWGAIEAMADTLAAKAGPLGEDEVGALIRPHSPPRYRWARLLGA